MIRFLENPSREKLSELVDFCADGLLGVKAIGPLLSYGTGYSFVQSFEQRDEDENLTAFLSVSYGDLVIYTADPMDSALRTELLDFLKVISWQTLTGDAKFFQETPTGMQMEFPKGSDCIAVPSKEPLRFVENTEFRAYYDLLAENNPGYFPAPYPDWLVDFSHRVRHGTARSLLLEADGKFVSTAGALSITEPAVFIGAISTNPDCRGRHFAHTGVKFFADAYPERRIYLMCMPEKQRFYEKAGMQKVGEFTVIHRG